jgi:hypothetical protein
MLCCPLEGEETLLLHYTSSHNATPQYTFQSELLHYALVIWKLFVKNILLRSTDDTGETAVYP